MKNLYYAVAAMLLILWAVGFFVFDAGVYTHLLFVPVALLLLKGWSVNRKKHAAFKPMQLSLDKNAYFNSY
ncbi:MAG: DUF5670 family protein [Chitinophagales bacterium]